MDPISQGAECQLGAGPILLCSGKTHHQSSSWGCDKGSKLSTAEAKSSQFTLFSIMQTVIAVRLQQEAFKEHELMSRKREWRKGFRPGAATNPFMSQTNHVRQYLLSRGKKKQCPNKKRLKKIPKQTQTWDICRTSEYCGVTITYT